MAPVERITREMFGNIPVIPAMSTGATDSKYFRELGVPAFGVSGLFMDPTVDARATGGTSGCGSSRTTRDRSFSTGSPRR